MPRKYLFIDGGFIQGFFRDCRRLIKPEIPSIDDIDIPLARIGAGFDRIFYYDAYPERKDDQKAEEYDQEYNAKSEFFQSISRIRNFSVRTALTKNRAKRGREQKGVDVLLAIDVLLHAVRGNIDEATIMTSDADFFPLFEALLQTKTRSVLRYDVRRTAPELIDSADYSRPVTTADFFEWGNTDGRLKVLPMGVGKDDLGDAGVVARGSIADRGVTIMYSDQSGRFFAEIEDRGRKTYSNSVLSKAFLIGQLERDFAASVQLD